MELQQRESMLTVEMIFFSSDFKEKYISRFTQIHFDIETNKFHIFCSGITATREKSMLKVEKISLSSNFSLELDTVCRFSENPIQKNIPSGNYKCVWIVF